MLSLMNHHLHRFKFAEEHLYVVLLQLAGRIQNLTGLQVTALHIHNILAQI